MRNAFLSSVLLLVLLGTLSGCSRYYWSKPGATAEQFSGDSQACVQQAARTLPPGSSAEAFEQVYRGCLNSRGYVRDKQFDPPPPGYWRGIEDNDQFSSAAQAVMGRAPQQSLEQQLAQLDDLKARGRITDAEYATMRKRIVEGATPGALTAPPAPPPPPAVAAAPARALAGRWYGRNGSTLDIRGEGTGLQWDWELVSDRGTQRATGTGSASGNQISLIGRPTAGMPAASVPSYTFSLTWEGDVLRGTATGTNNLPISVEFRRERP